MTQFLPISDDRFSVAEGPVWDATTQRLFWVDIIGRTIHAHHSEGKDQVWHSDDFPTALALSKSGQKALVALASGMAWLDLEAGRFTRFAEPDTVPGNRLNEGKCDPQGRFWAGTMQNNLNADGSGKDMDRNSGALFRVDPDGTISQHTGHEFGIANTLAWSPDGTSFYFGDSVRNVIFAYDWHADEGCISNPRVHLEGFERGAPDGSAIDEDGCLWNARFGGSCLVRITPKGVIDQIIELPVTNPTSCTFGGSGRKTLYVTSAQFTLSDEQLITNPLEGAVLSAGVPIAGVSDHTFG
ncbi:MAG: SMP-30/gluconolactonase/LRE family protein [Alphaproteobacteria bacterium]